MALSTTLAPPVGRPRSTVSYREDIGATGQEPRSERVIHGGLVSAYWLFVALWLGTNAAFWSWWLRPQNIGVPWLYVLFTVALAYDVSFLPSIYLYYVGHMRRPRPIATPPGFKVAMITLCVPKNESLAVIVKQLEALAVVRYPHDSWVLDEGNNPSVREEARRLGVHYFSRAGLERYNQPGPPFQAKTKAGNVNAWLDAFGKSYEFFVQFDIDHRPVPAYLDRVLGFFTDRSVAWVQAPSIYGNVDSWVARGAAEQELVLQGPLQQGFYGATQTPFIIGSHCTYRTQAVLDIGGFQPTRAEDHLDTMFLASRGHQGVFVPETLALGDGPTTFETYLRQQFAWAYSMMQILFNHSPRLIRRFPPKQAFQFLFAQSWYMLWSTSMVVLFSLPLLTLLTGARPSTVDFASFALRGLPVGLVGFAIWRWTRRWQSPAGLGLSWRGVLLHVARWPVVFWALINVVLQVKHPYMITPKGESADLPRFPLVSQLLYLSLAWLSTAVIWISMLQRNHPEVEGYVVFTLLGAFWMLAVVIANVLADATSLLRRGIGLLGVARLRTIPLALLILTLAGMGLTATTFYSPIIEAASWHEATPARVVRDAASTNEGRPAQRMPVLAQTAPSALVPTAEAIPARNQPDPVPGPDATPTSSRVRQSGQMRQPDAVGGPDATQTLTLDLPSSLPVVGVYDPFGLGATVPVGLEEWFVPEDRPNELALALAQARNRRTPLITIEPSFASGSSDSLLRQVATGQRDAELRRLATLVRQAQPQIVLLRWGHLMDLFGLYPWSVDDPSLYQAAYRRVVATFRAEGAVNARWVWSSAGTNRAMDFYPGDDVVDYVGLTILGDAQWDATFGKAPQSFTDILRPQYDLVKRTGRPIIIAELGVSGTPTRQSQWLTQAGQSISEFPLVRALVYFDAVNAPNNHMSTEPDWSISSRALVNFANGVTQGSRRPPVGGRQ